MEGGRKGDGAREILDFERALKRDYQTDQKEMAEGDERKSWMGWSGVNDAKGKVYG